MAPTKLSNPSLDFRGWWSPVFGATGLILPVFIQTEKHIIQRCTPCNALALQSLLSPGRWGHAYLPDEISLTTIEIHGKPATDSRSGHYNHALFTADRLTLYGNGLHRGVCEFIISELVHTLREGYYHYSKVLQMFGEETPAPPDIFRNVSRAMRAIVAVYEAHQFGGRSVVSENWRSIWTDENGYLLGTVSRPFRYQRETINLWAVACICSAGGSVRGKKDQSITIEWNGYEHDTGHIHWWFEQVGYSPSSDWQTLGKLVLAASESAMRGGIICATGHFQYKRGGYINNLDYFIPAIVNAINQDFQITYESEPPGELIAGVVLTIIGKFIVSVCCTFVTAGGPWLVIWLTTALTRWPARDVGNFRLGGKCGGRGYHLHAGDKCLLKFLHTSCITSAGSEHSRVLGVIVAAIGWAIAYILYIFFPYTRILMSIQEWDSALGFAIANFLIFGLCFVGVLTMSYKLPKEIYQRYYWLRMGLEWIIAIVAIVAGLMPTVILKKPQSRWMLVAEAGAWAIDAILTLFVIGTFPDSITPWHSVWVLIPALLSMLGGIFGCFN